MKSFQELKRLSKRANDAAPSFKMAMLGDSATQLLALAIRGEGIARGWCIDMWEADYNQIERQMLDRSSDYHAFAPDYTVIFQSTHKLLEQYALLGEADRGRLCDERIRSVESLIACSQGRIVYFNYPETDDGVFGQYGNKVPSSFIGQLRRLNVALMELAQRTPNFHICDLAALQAKLGRDRMFDAAIYAGTEMVLSVDSLPYVASRVMDIVGSLQGKFKKCLVCDLDNTLWGGVVGDDGWENIQIGHGLGAGKVFTELQQWVKKLRERGILLAVCSKNNEETAKEPFEKHPEMVLSLEDFAVFVANWENKADNIRRIQQMLNIGMDAIVFLDDNPFERNLVRESIPEITVPELPVDPADYLEYLYGENLFETTSYSAFDADRTRQYRAEALRESSKAAFMNEDDFLKSLNMRASVEGFSKYNTPRVAQLSQRSNQFNLRTVRYTEEEIVRIGLDREHYAAFTFTLEDKFGDNGLICVVILEKKDADTLFIDTWFMSCRVLKRGMENFTLNVLVDYARRSGCKRMVGEYIPTAKNRLVEHHYEQLGFTPLDEAGTRRFVLDVANYEDLTCHITRVTK